MQQERIMKTRLAININGYPACEIVTLARIRFWIDFKFLK